MNVRSSVLVALLVTVPAIAMFSHHVPAGAAEAARRMLVEPVTTWVRGWNGGPASAPSRLDRDDALPAAEAALPTAPTAVTEADRVAVRDRLRAAGAVAIESRALPGGESGHMATCRIPLDAEGQLQRVFQATGHDALAAERRLLEDVSAWQARRPR